MARKALDWERLARLSRHPLQVALLEAMLARNGKSTVTPRQLADELGRSLPLVAYHIRVLASDGLIVLVRTKPVRGTLEHHYRLATGAKR